MGQLHFFLGMEVIPTKSVLFLSLHKYIQDLLSKTNMTGAKEVSTPLSTSMTLKMVDGTVSFDSMSFEVSLEVFSNFLSHAQTFVSQSINYHNLCINPR